MIFTDSIKTFPFLIVVSVIDFYAFMLAARLILQRCSNMQAQHALGFFRALTDPLAQAVHQRLTKSSGRILPMWVSWASVCVAILVLRSLLMCLISELS